MLTSFQKVFKGPLNTGNSKNLYSFPKQQRFQKIKQLTCKKSYYDFDKLKTMRSTSFGFGKRSSLTCNQTKPSPGQYQTNSSSKLKKGYTFSNYKKISFVDQASSNLAINPGPGKYQKTFFQKSFSFSMRSKYQDPLHRHKNKLGPGQYKILDTISKNGIYNQSKHRSSGCSKIGKQKRFGSNQTFTPGPGKYKDQLGIDPLGNYFNSRVMSKGIRSFAGPNRNKLFLVGNNPGPGTYYIFPQFPNVTSAR